MLYTKSKETLAFPDNYTVIDLETTGLNIEEDSIIEIAALKVKSGKEAEYFQTLISCPITITQRIQNLTGISNEMLMDAPIFSQIAGQLSAFIDDDIIIGHAILFDITFLSKAFLATGFMPLENLYIDTLPISQKLLPELVHHRLKDMASYYKFDTTNAHRAMVDCNMNYQVFEAMKQTIINTYTSYDTFISNWNTLSKRIKADMISTDIESFDTTHLLYQKNCVITGALDRFSRKEAMQIIANLGGINMDKLNTSTDILILGNGEYCDLLTGITKKQKKALRLIDEGYPIKIITELEFYQLLS